MAKARWFSCFVLWVPLALSCGGATAPAKENASSTGGSLSQSGSAQGNTSIGGNPATATRTTPASSGGSSATTTFAATSSGSGGVAASTSSPITGAGGVTAILSTAGNNGAGGSGVSWPTFVVPTSGALIPSLTTGFETGISGWGTFDGTSGVRQVTDASTGEGSSYLTCDGAQRGAEWDGPAIDIYPQISLGRTYELTAAVRFSPRNPVTVPSMIGMTVATYCTNSAEAAAYSPLASVTTGNTWTRIRGSFTLTLPRQCTSVTKVLVYFGTSQAMQNYSFDIDDFQVWDVSPRGGTGGAPNQGAAGSAGSGG